MKIAISSTGEGPDSQADSRFGRAKGFVIYDDNTDAFTYVSNDQVKNTAQGAGIQSARHVVDAGVEALLTGHCGPKAFKALQAAGVKVYTGIQGSVRTALDEFKAGNLTLAENADVEGHWI